VVVGGADRGGSHDAEARFDVRRFGTTAERQPAPAGLPLSLGVGRRLLDEARWSGPTTLVAMRRDASVTELDALVEEVTSRPGDVGLLLLGDGSARRGPKAPGFLDERAFGFDDAVAAALRDGDAAALRGLDADLAEELMVGGAAVLRLLGAFGATRGVRSADLDLREDPFGVSYFVARWELG
jgi:hypothetical protein